MGRVLRWCVALASFGAACVWAEGSSLSVAPTTVEVPPEGLAELYVINRSNAPTLVQIEPFDWNQPDGQDRLAESSSLQVSPPMARVESGQRQLIRLRVPVSGDGEHSYRLLVSQLPDTSANNDKAIKVLLQFSVPVFAGAPEHGEPSLQWRLARSGDGTALQVHNGGSTRAKLVHIALSVAGGAPVEVAPNALTYVLAGATRRWILHEPALRAGALVDVATQGEGRSAPVHETVIVSP